jgi:DNA-binding transcriptional regulator YiaG
MAELCRNCGKEYEVRVASPEEPYFYTESGLPYIRLIGIPVYSCAKCKAESAEIPQLEVLHGLIAKYILLTPLPMTGAEVRFLRKEARLKPQEFAEKLGVEPRTIPNWEKSEKLSRQVDVLIRVSTISELWQGDERADMLSQLAELLKYPWEPAEEEAGAERTAEQAIADLTADNVAYGLNANHEWGMAA